MRGEIIGGIRPPRLSKALGDRGVMGLGPIPDYTLYSRGQVTLATFLGGPLGGTVLMAQNYRRVGSYQSSRSAIAYGLLFTGVLVIVAFVLPQSFPRMAIPVGYTLAMAHVSDLLQAKMFAAHIQSSGRKSSWWVTVGLGSLCLIVTIGVFLVGALVVPERLMSK